MAAKKKEDPFRYFRIIFRGITKKQLVHTRKDIGSRKSNMPMQDEACFHVSGGRHPSRLATEEGLKAQFNLEQIQIVDIHEFASRHDFCDWLGKDWKQFDAELEQELAEIAEEYKQGTLSKV